MRRSLIFAFSGLLGLPAAAHADSPLSIIVVREHGVGSAATAQTYLDSFVQSAATINKWPSAKGTYLTERKTAETAISQTSPHFGILGLETYLALRKSHALEVLGQADIAQGGGRQFYLVSKNAATKADCKHQPVASLYADDPKFLNTVVLQGSFKTSDFTLVPTSRPVQTIKKVLRDEATCALIDDAQHASLKNIDGGSSLKTLWTSPKLPPMVVVAFKTSNPAERASFKANLPKICQGTGKKACADVGITSLAPATSADYKIVTQAYGE